MNAEASNLTIYILTAIFACIIIYLVIDIYNEYLK